jgi:endo-1,4-beta-xylanase
VAWCYENCSGGTEIVNDYNLLSSSSNASQIRSVKNACGASAVGCEAHSLEGVSSSTISSCFSTIGGTIYVSELDIRGSDSEQLSIYQSIFPTLQRNSSGTTLWGYVQGTMWRSDAYLITSSGSRRPAMNWLCDNYLNCRHNQHHYYQRYDDKHHYHNKRHNNHHNKWRRL